MEHLKAQITVIGAGPAGQKAAIQAVKLGKSVIVVDALQDPGGNCLYNGTIPSKTLREAILDLTRFHERNFYGDQIRMETVTINDLNNRLYRVIDEERKLVYRQFKKNEVLIVQGWGEFENPHVLNVRSNNGDISHQITSETFIIAVGSKPRNPIDVPFDDEVILDSTLLLGLKKVPKSLIVLGGGIVGSEYASFFAALGTEVTIIDKRDHILPMLDSEIGIHLQTALTDLGLKFLGNKIPKEIFRVDDRACVKFQDGTILEAEALLYALGRTANVDALQIAQAGIEKDSKGYIVVNALFQTGVNHIYAVGDVIGGPCLASTSMEQGRLAARHACGVELTYFPPFYPIGIYTIPEISCLGYTEDELKNLGFRYEVGRAYYHEIARSHIVGTHRGLLKLIFHAETLEILGVHVIGRGATEVIHIGQTAKSFHAKIDFFIEQIFNYPTFAEAYRIAALNGMNKIKTRIV